ncbi:MAG: ankyrin repeat domain-containing protein [Alphaproteobacteria bacterium]|nr:MAG: ankyrin repeat domain-containing protein [Alphaproteobacteria bacterium]
MFITRIFNKIAADFRGEALRSELGKKDEKKINDRKVLRLIQKGADLKGTDWIGNTALHWAIYSKKKEAILAMIDKGADINQQNVRGETALLAALWFQVDDVVPILLEKGARTDLRDAMGNGAESLALAFSKADLASQIRTVYEQQTGERSYARARARSFERAGGW